MSSSVDHNVILTQEKPLTEEHDDPATIASTLNYYLLIYVLYALPRNLVY